MVDLLFSSISDTSGLPPDGTMLNCGVADQAKVVTLFHSAMLFGWDMTMWLGNPKMQIDIGHHGSIEIYSRENIDQLSVDFSDLSGGRVLEIRDKARS